MVFISSSIKTRKMTDWAGRAATIAILGILVMLTGYGWHDITDSYSRDLEEKECNMVFAMPFGYTSQDIETCKNFQMSNIVIIIGWAMIIGGIIGYFALPGDLTPKKNKAQKKAKPKETKEEKPKDTSISKGAEQPKGPPAQSPQIVEKVVLMCPKCGAKNEEDSDFCKKCGKHLRPGSG